MENNITIIMKPQYLLVTTTQHMMNTYCLNEPKNKSMVNNTILCIIVEMIVALYICTFLTI